MEEKDYICCSYSCCNGSKAAAIAALSFSLLLRSHSHVLTFSLSALSTILSLIFLSNISLLYRHFMVNMEGPIALKHGMNCSTIHAPLA